MKWRYFLMVIATISINIHAPTVLGSDMKAVSCEDKEELDDGKQCSHVKPSLYKNRVKRAKHVCVNSYYIDYDRCVDLQCKIPCKWSSGACTKTGNERCK